jgi:hypothetical protein
MKGEANMGSVSIFNLNFSGTVFACSRDFAGAYRLQIGDYVVTMTPGEAAALARGGTFIQIKMGIARRFDRDLRPGVAYRRDLLAVNGRVARLEIGVSDSGYIYLGGGSERMALTDGQADMLLAVLNTLAADAGALYRAMAPTHDGMQWGVAAGLREADPDLALPRWADDDQWR